MHPLRAAPPSAPPCRRSPQPCQPGPWPGAARSVGVKLQSYVKIPPYPILLSQMKNLSVFPGSTFARSRTSMMVLFIIVDSLESLCLFSGETSGWSSKRVSRLIFRVEKSWARLSCRSQESLCRSISWTCISWKVCGYAPLPACARWCLLKPQSQLLFFRLVP